MPLRKPIKVLIIGGVAGGATAAARLRRLNEDAQIIIIERSGFISYANCALPYYIGGVIEEKEELTLQSPQSFWRRFRIEARTDQEAISIERSRKEVRIKDLTTNAEYVENYDYLILSPGAEAIIPPLPGVDSKRILTLRHTEDAFSIREHAEKFGKGSAVVIGGGFVGLESAENLREMGMDVTLIQLTDHVMQPFDDDMASFLHREMRKNGINLRLKTAVTGFEDGEDGFFVLAGDEKFKADFAILSVGVRPDTKIAREAGLETDRRGSIIVDDTMKTSDDYIYAAGDAVSILNRASGTYGMIALAGPANKEGRVAADNIAGLESHYRGSTGASVLKLFSLTAAAVGINEETASAMGMDYDTVFTLQGNHAAYYPGAESIMLKAIYERKTGRILGAQAVGRSGTDKRIDTLSMAVAYGLNADDLASMDMAYAPPYSSAKDPVNIIGYIAGNKLRGILEEFSYKDIPSIDFSKEMLIDLRTESETARGMIDGAINIPLDELRDHLDKLDRSKTILVYCRSGQRSYIGARILEGHGFRAKSLSGGYMLYESVMNDRKNR